MADLYRNPEQVKGYASYRPSYPPELFNFIYSKTTGRRQLAWDVATGSGQAAVSLSSLFDAVVATDSSPEQISHAPTHLPNVRFVVTPPSLTIPDLHRLVAPPGSVDLITVATALHWLDIPAFFSQAHAVLRRPGGVVAVWGYGFDLLIGSRRVEEIYRRIRETISPYCEKDVREMVQEGYAGVDFPFEAVEGVEEGTAPVRKFMAEREMGVAELIGLWQTSTPYQRARKAGVELITEEVVEELKRAWVEEDGGELNKKKMVRFPISLRIGVESGDLFILSTSVQQMDLGNEQAVNEKQKTYIHWTSEMDTALSSALLDQLNLGNKEANGWKGVAFTAGITALWEECHVRMTKEKIMARLKTWNKYFQEISAMLDTSGFGWDWDKHVVKVDSPEVWADYIRAHPSLRHYKNNVIVNWSDLAALCGSDKATGVNSATSVESANQIHVEDTDDEDEFGNGSMGPRRKKAKKPSNLDKIAEAVTHIAFNLDGPAEVAPLVQPRREMTQIEMMYAALAPMTDLSEADMISAIDMLAADEIKCECFLVMPEILRRAWLRVHLGD